jgi:glycosyl hydrolase family 113
VRRAASGAELVIEAADDELAQLADRATGDHGLLLGPGIHQRLGGRLVAARFDDEHAQVWLERLGVERTGAGLRYAGLDFGGPGDLLIACFEDPDHAGLPVAVYLGGDEPLRGWLGEARPLSRRPSARLVIDRRTALTARLTQAGELIDADRRALGAERASLVAELEAHELPAPLKKLPELAGLSVLRGPGVSAERADDYLSRCAATMNRARTWCGAAAVSIQLTLVATGADYARLGGLDDLGTRDPTGHLVSALLAPGLPDDSGAALARAVAFQAWGPPVDDSRELAFGFAAAGQCWGRSLDGFAGAYRNGPLNQLVERARIYAQRGADGQDDSLREDWTSLPERSFEHRVIEHIDPVHRQSTLTALRELRGIVLELPPTRLHDTNELHRDGRLAADFGANGASVSCTFIAQDVLPEMIGDRVAGWGRTEQGDALLVAALAELRAAGLMHLTLRPKLLDSSSGEEAGRRKRTTATEWAEFFATYVAAIEHAATLAEFVGIDVVCVGEGLGNATRTEVDDHTGLGPEVLRIKRDGWSQVVAAARSRFGGDVAYLADWPQEAQRLAFWGEVDFIALTWFPALREGGPDQVEPTYLRRLLYGQLSMMDRFAAERELPYVVLAAGLPATELAWRDATLAAGAEDEAEQARLYTALAWAVDAASERLDGFRGIALTGWGHQVGASHVDRAVGRPAEVDLKQILAGGRDAD